MKFSKYNLFIPSEDQKNQYILFNTLTGHSFLVDSQIKNDIDSNNINNFSDDILKQYSKCGIVLEDNVDERRYYEYNYNKAKFTSAVLNSTVLLTWACNLKCIYCYEGAGEKFNEVMTKESANKYIAFLKKEAELRNSKLISVILFGGEPLLNFKLGKYILSEIKRYCTQKNKTLVSGIVTNGTLITDEILNDLKEYNCRTIQITLDGTKNIHDSRRMYKNNKGSFDKVINSIKLICNKSDYVKPVIRINVDKTNLDTTFDLLKYLSDNNLTSCNIDFGIVHGETQACSAYINNCINESQLGETLDLLWKQAKSLGFKMNIRPLRRWLHCGLYNDSSFTVAPNADVYKCWEHVGEPKHRIGKLDECGNLKDVNYTFYDWMTRNPLETDSCSKCVYLPVCGGGCGSISYNRENSYHGKGCFKIKGVLEKQILHFLKEKNLIGTPT